MKSTVVKYYKYNRIYNINHNARGNMNYKKIALQLFDELSGIYAADIEKHANLCRRYPRLCKEWVKNIESNIDADRIYNDCCYKEQKERIWRELYKRIEKESEKQWH